MGFLPVHETATQGPAPICALCPLCLLNPYLRRRARRHCCAMRNLFPFPDCPTSRVQPCDRFRVCSARARMGDNRGKLAVLRDGFDIKAWGEAWEHDLSSDAGIDTDDEAGAPKLFAPPRAPVPRPQSTAVDSDIFPPSSSENVRSTPLPSVNNLSPTPEQAYSREELRREHTRRLDCDPAWDLQHSRGRVGRLGL